MVRKRPKVFVTATRVAPVRPSLLLKVKRLGVELSSDPVPPPAPFESVQEAIPIPYTESTHGNVVATI